MHMYNNYNHSMPSVKKFTSLHKIFFSSIYLQFQTYKEPFHSLLEQYRSFLHSSSIGENLWHHNVLPDSKYKTLMVILNVIKCISYIGIKQAFLKTFCVY